MRTPITIFTAIVVFVTLGFSQYKITDRSTDSLNIIVLYDSTNGDSWTDNTNWKTAEPIDNWYGITVTDGRITEINLKQNNVDGPLPEEIGNLSELTRLDISKNWYLSGELPESIGNLTNLTYLNLYRNELTGSIPDTLGNLTKLTYLALYQNQFTGTIPEALGNLTDVYYLALNENQLEGTIPESIGNMASLIYLLIYKNQLTGTIPDTLGSLPSLGTLLLNDNQLTGEIPQALGRLSNMTSLSLHNNQLTGVIPDTLANLTSLQSLYLRQNQFTGTVPERIAEITNLMYLYLNDNQLDELPDLSALSNLDYLEVQDNRFTFEDIEPNIGVAASSFNYAPQDSIGAPLDTSVNHGESITFDMTVGGASNQYQWFKDDILYSGATNPVLTISPAEWADAGIWTCQITNTVATDLTLYSHPINLTVMMHPREADSLALVALYDSTNGDSWTTNTNWKTAEPLENWYKVKMLNGRVDELNLGGNNLVGTIPDEIGNLTAITYLALVSNSLSGPIPSSIGNLTELENLALSHNSLTGTIPEEIYDLTKLTSLSFQNNYGIEGTISSKIGQLTDLEILMLESMSLEGPIPDEICNLTNLWILKLGNNLEISGTIPANIGNLVNLKDLSLYNNSLTGTIPEGIGDLVNLEKLVFSGNDLTGTIPDGIGNLVKLTELQFAKNEFGGTVPDTLNALVEVIYLALNDNSFTELNSLSGMAALNTLSIYNNNFTFEDIERNIGVPASNFYYSPQDSVGEPMDTTITEGDDLYLEVKAGGEYNVYVWKLDGNVIAGADSDSYTITSAVLADSGIYTCEITNTVATELTLYSYSMIVAVDPTTAIDDEGFVPNSWALYQNYPNPFNPTTTIKYDLPNASEVTIKIYNVFGQSVKTLVSGMQTAGRKNVVWDGKDVSGNKVASGIYFYQVSSPSFSKTMKMILIK